MGQNFHLDITSTPQGKYSNMHAFYSLLDVYQGFFVLNILHNFTHGRDFQFMVKNYAVIHFLISCFWWM